MEGVMSMRFRTRARILTWLNTLGVLLILAAGFVSPVAAQRGDEDGIDEDLEELGVTSETSWESPQFGTEVTWGDDWEVMAESTYTSPDEFKDGLSIGTETVYLGVTVIESPGESPAEYMERLVELREDETEDFEVIDDGEDGDLAYLTSSAVSEDNLYYNVVEVTYLDEDEGLLILVEVSMWENEVEDAFELAVKDVVVDDRDPFLHYNADLVLEVIDEASN
jgi:hypothetical protein